MEVTRQKIWDLCSQVQGSRPLIHCITNYVTMNDCANILLAAGASPTMAHHPKEVAEVTQGCNSLVCNLGATDDYEAMLVAVKAAKEAGHPIVIDPVGVGGSSFRREQFWKLLELAKPTCVRGNLSEIQALVENRTTVTGVDAAADILTLEKKDSLVKSFSKKIGCIVTASGAVDIISDGEQCLHVVYGTPELTRITGCGCMSSALIAAYLAAENSIEAVASACAVMGICGELAEEKTKEQQGGTMTFRVQLIDQISLLRKTKIV